MGIETALLGSALIGGVSSYSSAKRMESAQGRSDELNAKALAMQQNQQMFNQQRYLDAMLEYEKMANIYGPLQEDVATYFQNLTGEKLSNDRIAKLQLESQRTKERIQQNLAQSGRGGTGLEAYLLAQNEYNTAESKAAIRTQAEMDALNQQMRYLGLVGNQADMFRQRADMYANQVQGSINTQGALLGNMGIQGINTAGNINNIYSNYANQLQSGLGTYYAVTREEDRLAAAARAQGVRL